MGPFKESLSTFLRSLGGKYVRSAEIQIGGSTFEEVGYGSTNMRVLYKILTKISPIRPLYDERASLYDGQPRPATEAERADFKSFVSTKKTDVILDIGCGTGRLTIPISKRCKKIVGVDFSDKTLAIAREKSTGLNNIEFRKHDVTKKLPFKNASFEKVICLLAINHISNVLSFFKEIQRVLKIGGLFVFDDVKS